MRGSLARCAALGIASVLFLPAAAGAATIDVTAGSADTGGLGAAANGNCTIREAIQSANSNTAIDACTAGGTGTDTVAIPAGTYTLAGPPAFNNFTGDLEIYDATSGGTSPGSLVVHGAGSGPGGTTIDANHVDRVLSALPTPNLEPVVLDGIRFTGGSITGDLGGGLEVGRHTTIQNSIVTGNTLSVTAANDGGAGVAVFGGDGTDVHIVNTTISGNTVNGAATDAGGAGLFVTNGFADHKVTISGSTITGNIGTFVAGGGIFDQSIGSLDIEDSHVDGNTAGLGGGGIYAHGGDTTVHGSTVDGNHSTTGGGGLAVDGGNVFLDVDQSEVSDNVTTVEGGGLKATNQGVLTVSRTLVQGNSVTGAQASGGGMTLETDAITAITNSWISDNTATPNAGTTGAGGGIQVSGPGAAQVVDSTINGNKVTGANATGHGGGVSLAALPAQLVLTNSTVQNNAADGTAGGNFGAGIFSAGGNVQADFDTLLGNDINNGGQGSALYKAAGGSNVQLRNSVLNAGTPANTCKGDPPADEGGNVDGGTSCGFTPPNSVNNADGSIPNGSVADHGGPLIGPAPGIVLGTRALDSGPGVDLVPANACKDFNSVAVVADERGVERPDGAGCDSGAYESATCEGQTVGQGWLLGGAGDDSLTGTAGDDKIATGAGNDTVDAGGGADTVCAGSGDDTLTLDDGAADTADCGAGADSYRADSSDALSACETNLIPPLIPPPVVPAATGKPKPKKCKKKKKKAKKRSATVAKKKKRCKKKKKH